MEKYINTCGGDSFDYLVPMNGVAKRYNKETRILIESAAWGQSKPSKLPLTIVTRKQVSKIRPFLN